MQYAGLWKRFLALFIDLLLFCALFFPTTRLVKGVWLMSAADHALGYGAFITDPLCIAFLIFMTLYFIFLEGLLGYTLGKWIMGLRVISLTGGRPGLGRSVARNLLRVVDGLPTLNLLGVALIIDSKEKARFGDRIAGTRVVAVPQPKRNSGCDWTL